MIIHTFGTNQTLCLPLNACRQSHRFQKKRGNVLGDVTLTWLFLVRMLHYQASFTNNQSRLVKQTELSSFKLIVLAYFLFITSTLRNLVTFKDLCKKVKTYLVMDLKMTF